MLHRWAALVLVLALWVLKPEQAAGQQSQQPRGHKSVGALGRNYPNPFNPETTIPFHVGPDDCATDGGQQHVISVKIYNVLAQLVAIPKLNSSGERIENLRVACGDYSAFWDGHYLGTEREVASGIYLYELVVDGQHISPKKMFVAK